MNHALSLSLGGSADRVMWLRRVAVRRFFSSGSGSNEIAGTIAELNKEMESVFGEPPSSSFAGFNDSHLMDSGPQEVCPPKAGMEEFGLTHIDSKGQAQMVDVSPKEVSKRAAIASCRVILGKKVFDMVSTNQMAKGDVLTVSKIAGIGGAKQTSNLIPLCHNVNLTHVSIDIKLNASDFSIEIEGEAASTGKTGVEMEALTAVSVAGLTVYDMCKAVSKDIQVTNVRLERKIGGKSGDWSREE